MCLEEPMATELREYLEEVERVKLNGTAIDIENIIASACEDARVDEVKPVTKSDRRRMYWIFRGIGKRFPQAFSSDNERNRAARRASISGDRPNINTEIVANFKSLADRE